MPQLEFADDNGEDLFLNVLLYGGPKTGKTVGAGSAPGPILYVNADRPNATRYMRHHTDAEVREVAPSGLQTLMDVATALQDPESDFASVVVDPIGDLYRNVLEGQSGRAVRPKIQEYGDTGTYLERFCRTLCDLPVNAILVCHEISTRDEDSGSFERLPYTGTNNPALAAKLMSMVDVIGYTGVVAGTEDSPTKYLAQTVNGGGRKGGDRFGVLGTSRDVNITEWVSLARGSIAAE